MDATHQLAGWIVGAVVGLAALVGGIRYLLRQARAGVHVLDRIEALLSKELEANHGSSMKDDITGIAFTVGNLWRRLEAVERDLSDHLTKRGKP